MSATLKRADKERSYSMTDHRTWVAEKGSTLKLQILFRGDKFLIKTYQTLAQPDGVTAAVKFFISYVRREAKRSCEISAKNSMGRVFTTMLLIQGNMIIRQFNKRVTTDINF